MHNTDIRYLSMCVCCKVFSYSCLYYLSCLQFKKYFNDNKLPFACVHVHAFTAILKLVEPTKRLFASLRIARAVYKYGGIRCA